MLKWQGGSGGVILAATGFAVALLAMSLVPAADAAGRATRAA
jgi:hypothetical protein